MDVLLYAAEVEHEPAQIEDKLPLPLPPLDAITVVRIFGLGDTVVRAKYDGDGNLQEMHASSKMVQGGFQSEIEPGKKYGMPPRFPVADYLKDPHLDWKDMGKPNPANMINFHYDYNRWVRSDQFDSEGNRTTRYLTYIVTPEDTILEPIDRRVPFGQRERPPHDRR